MTDRQIADINKNGREHLRIALSEYKGARFVDVRLYCTDTTGALVPSKKGVTINRSMLRQAIEALTEAERLLSAENGGARG